MWGLLEAPLVLHAVNMNAVPLFVTQRCSRIAYSRSNIRLLAAVVVYSAVQAFVLLGIAQYALPHSWTGGQGAISMWCVVWPQPRLVLPNTPYDTTAGLKSTTTQAC